MFTGIIEEIGTVRALERGTDSARLRLHADEVASDVGHGASVAVDGICLTVVEKDGAQLGFDVMGETLARTGLGGLEVGSTVNLERAVPVTGRLDGHIVTGHVDGVGEILERVPGDNWELVRISMPADLARYVAPKGSIAVDGISLTVVGVGPEAFDGGSDWFSVGIIPQTSRATTIGAKPVSAQVNLEVDVLAKYTERLLGVADRADLPQTREEAR